MKILMFITDFVTYKTYLDLKNYLYNNNCTDIELNYFYFPYSSVNGYYNNNNNTTSFVHITRYMEKDYTNKEYGYCMTHTRFMESFLSILNNYVNRKENLIDIDNIEGLYFNNLDWYNEYGENMTKERFINTLSEIPHSDIYLLSSRDNISCSASLSVELALALYLIRKYGSKVFIGGNHFNEPNNPIVELINAVGREYTNGKLEYLVGTIGINIYNYIKGYEYQNKRSPIERNVLPILNLDNTLLNNNFAIELIRGCEHRCPYCCNGFINKYDNVNIDIYKQWLNYLNKYPQYCISLFAPELNTNNTYFIHTLRYLILHNIKNPLSFYINLNYITDEQIECMQQLNINELKFSIDLLFDIGSYRKYKDIDDTYTKIDKLLSIKTKKTNIHLVANIPYFNKITYEQYKEVFHRYYNNIFWNEFHIFTSTPYFYNPSKYGIDYIYYQNRYKKLTAINQYINKLPVMYFRNDLNRKEMVNNYYEILRNMIKDILRSDSNNPNFLFALLHSVLPDLDYIDRHNKILDNIITKFSQIIGYKNSFTQINITDKIYKFL